MKSGIHSKYYIEEKKALSCFSISQTFDPTPQWFCGFLRYDATYASSSAERFIQIFYIQVKGATLYAELVKSCIWIEFYSRIAIKST